MPLRLYLVDRQTGKKTGKKRDYPSVDHFNKYGMETYHRYNREFWYNNEPTGLKAEICQLIGGKWIPIEGELLVHLLAGILTDDL